MYVYLIKHKDGKTHWNTHHEESGAGSRLDVLIRHYYGGKNPVVQAKVVKVSKVILTYESDQEDNDA